MFAGTMLNEKSSVGNGGLAERLGVRANQSFPTAPLVTGPVAGFPLAPGPAPAPARLRFGSSAPLIFGSVFFSSLQPVRHAASTAVKASIRYLAMLSSPRKIRGMAESSVHIHHLTVGSATQVDEDREIHVGREAADGTIAHRRDDATPGVRRTR